MVDVELPDRRGMDGQRALSVIAAVLWVPWAAVLAAVMVTYARIAPEQLYHVSGSGLAGGISRGLVLLDFPIALVALPIIGLSVDRLRESRVAIGASIVAAALCLVVVVPGVVDQGDLDWRPVNLIPALGVALALGLGVWSGLFRERVPVRRAAVVCVAVVLVLSLPWLAADAGFHLDAVPLLSRFFLTGTLVDGHAAVHLGHHHGLDGALLLLAALPLIPLSRRVRGRRLRLAIQIYAGLQIAYGLANGVQDGWNEQLWKRGSVDGQIPPMLHPTASIGWLVILVVAGGASVLIVRSGDG